MKDIDETFDWGESTQEFIDGTYGEIFTGNHYEKLYEVRTGDVVLDLGASVGPFTWRVSDRASKIYSFEPTPVTYKVLEKNFKSNPKVEVIKKALYHTTGSFKFPFEEGVGGPSGTMSDKDLKKMKDDGILVDTITFQDFIKEYNIDKIDFIKTDCEGGEYSLFREENINFLKNNVRNIVGEWHLYGESQMVEFRYFRDKFLKPHFPNHTVYSSEWGNFDYCVDITWSLFKDEPYDSVNAKNLPPFIDFYNIVYIHIKNE